MVDEKVCKPNRLLYNQLQMDPKPKRVCIPRTNGQVNVQNRTTQKERTSMRNQGRAAGFSVSDRPFFRERCPWASKLLGEGMPTV